MEGAAPLGAGYAACQGSSVDILAKVNIGIEY